MDLFSYADLQSLAEPDPDNLAISLFMPTHRFGSGVEADKLRWKNLVSGMESLLLEGMRRAEVEELLAPARDLQRDSMAWQYLSDGLAMFIRPGKSQLLRVPTPMPELAAVGSRSLVGPLLRHLSGEAHFLLLALSQRDVRLLAGSRHHVEPVETGGMATAVDDVVPSRESRSDTMARPASAANRGGPAIFYGHGAGEDHTKTDELKRFLRDVASGLEPVLAGQSLPLVAVGLDALVSGYREVNTYQNLIAEAVVHNADGLSTEQLHQLAWPVMQRRLDEEQKETSQHFHNLSSTGRASGDVPTVAAGAAQGRVETLFVNSDPWCWDQVEAESPLVFRMGTDDRFVACERIEEIVLETLANGGSVRATPTPLVPGSQIAAIFRY